MANYQEASVKLTNSTEQIKSCRKKKQKKTLRWRIATQIISNSKQ